MREQQGTGTVVVVVKYINSSLIPASSAWVGLAKPGPKGSWQIEPKGYQFWTHANETGEFNIKGLVPGNYSLYAWVPGFLGDFKYSSDLIISPGSEEKLGEVVYEPPRRGSTIWEIGIPDRTAAEFFIPDPSPNRTTQLSLLPDHDKYRQYGLWNRYTDLDLEHDLIYTVGASDYTKDWFFAHVPKMITKDTYRGTTWEVQFQLEDVTPSATYTLQLALASSNLAEIQVRFNNPDLNKRPLFTTKLVGYDNAIVRHGIRGLYYHYSIEVSGNLLHPGKNSLFLTQTRATNMFHGALYDYIRLENPPSS